MPVNGIIAEYNPFHNGHKYQLEESRRLTGADYTIVVMSGDFVQRGAPALVNKRLRAEMALRCGADLVLELPVLYATASSEYFAAGATALLDKLGVVTHLCFGSECGEIQGLKRIAAFLAQEPDGYRAALKPLLRRGLAYPDARAEALSLWAKKEAPPSSLPENCETLLSSPNNILGIDYIKEIMKRKSAIIPATVKRKGAGYHDSAESDGASPVSALAIRQALREGRSPDSLTAFMPREAAELLQPCPGENSLLYTDDLSGILYYKLLAERESGYEKYLDVSAELSNRIRNSLNGFTGFEAFCSLLKTKAFTHTRISRCLLHILMGIEKEDMIYGKALDYIPYARVLGFRRAAAPLLRSVKSNADIPLVTKLADAPAKLPPEAGRLFRQDIFAGELYKGIVCSITGRPAPSEFSLPLIIL